LVKRQGPALPALVVSVRVDPHRVFAWADTDVH
jgi:hypothetical protein